MKSKRKDVEATLQTLLVEKVLMIGWGLSQLAACVFVFSDWFEMFDYTIPVWLSSLGAAVFIGSVILLWKAHYDLGDNWSPKIAVHKGHKLVTVGVYKYMRHPLYIAHLLWSAAQPLLLHNWLAGTAAVVLFVPFYLVRAPREDNFLVKQLKDK